MAPFTSIVFFLIFYVNIVSSQSNNTTTFDNFTIEWQNFNLLTCAVPTVINVSLFTCLPSPNYTQIEDLTCLQEVMVNFDQTTCQSTTTAMFYTSVTSAATTQQQLITTTPIIVPTQTSTNMAGVITQSKQTTTAATSIVTQSSTTHGKTQTTMSSSTTSNLNINGVIYLSTKNTANTTNTATTTNATINTTITTHILTTTNATINITATRAAGLTVANQTAIAGNMNMSRSTTTALSTTTTDNIYSCQNVYIGTYCNVSDDACVMSQPCLNLATCYPNNTLPYGYLCRCRLDYSGYNCQYNNNACREDTCWNNGTCIGANTTVAAYNGSNFTCICVVGYDGVYCELKIDLCNNITCENRGVCETVQTNWQCLCLDSLFYYGDYCQFKTTKLRIREILSRSFAAVAIGAIVTTCGFIIIMDVLKYVFHIDPVEVERETYRRRRERQRHARRPMMKNHPKIALRFAYVS